MNVRAYGSPPFRVVVVHGGPGAAGDMASVARRLAGARGVLEPIQTRATLEEQADELRAAIEARASAPVVLIGHSWGAWLSLLVAARYPGLLSKLILVGAPAFDDQYVVALRENRLRPLNAAEREEFLALARRLGEPGADAGAMNRLAELAERSDTYAAVVDDEPSPVPGVSERASEIYAGVWPVAAQWRTEGKWLALLDNITCPVVAIHGANEPTPVESVAQPLSRAAKRFHLVVLDRCGHTPWRERWARDEFFAVLETEIT